MPSLFSLPLPPNQQPKAGTYIRRVQKKRKQRKEPHDEPPSSDAASSLIAEYSAVITPEERSQRRLAGQPLDKEPPKFPFPHSKERPRAAANHYKNNSSASSLGVENETSYIAREPSLHIQHLGVMTAILHRAMMAKDFQRANRALGLLLRDQIGGHDIDIRSEGRWGIGAEILLRRGTRVEQELATQISVSASPPPDRNIPVWPPAISPFYTMAGFEDAKRYYQGLITQYPFQRQAATAVNALDFYNALFNLWVFIINEESQAAQSFENQRSPEELESPISGSSGLHQIKRQELKHAQEVATRMDEAMSTFPYSDDTELMRLRAMVALWVADLIDYCSRELHYENEMQVDGESTDGMTTNIDEARESTFDGGLASRVESARSRDIAHKLVNKLQNRPPTP